MRVTKRSRDTERRAKKRRVAVLEAVKVEAKRVAGERRARELEERRAAERQERADRTEGPAARTREESTRPAGQQVTGGSDRQRGLTAKRKRRGPTHVRARAWGASLSGCWSKCIGCAAGMDDRLPREKSLTGAPHGFHVGHFH